MKPETAGIIVGIVMGFWVYAVAFLWHCADGGDIFGACTELHGIFYGR